MVFSLDPLPKHHCASKYCNYCNQCMNIMFNGCKYSLLIFWINKLFVFYFCLSSNFVIALWYGHIIKLKMFSPHHVVRVPGGGFATLPWGFFEKKIFRKGNRYLHHWRFSLCFPGSVFGPNSQQNAALLNYLEIRK